MARLRTHNTRRRRAQERGRWSRVGLAEWDVIRWAPTTFDFREWSRQMDRAISHSLGLRSDLLEPRTVRRIGRGILLIGGQQVEIEHMDVTFDSPNCPGHSKPLNPKE